MGEEQGSTISVEEAEVMKRFVRLDVVRGGMSLYPNVMISEHE